ncbi:MAG: vWA domain-containing protein [Elstera sp.]
MANPQLFAPALPTGLSRNQEGALAYAYGAEHLLAQMACTGTLYDGFYGKAEDQLTAVLAAAAQVDPIFVAQTAIYARHTARMKDMPALLTAYLTRAAPDLSVPVFRAVIDSGRMLRTFVQIVRSGRAGRKSFGTRPKRLVQRWLEEAPLLVLLQAATGKDPSLADIVRLVHPRPADASRRAFYGWLIGKPYDLAALPPEVAAFEAWKRDPSLPLPPVPFEWLTHFPLNGGQWSELTARMGWNGLRMNLNSLARHKAFLVPGLTERVAARMGDLTEARRAKLMPHQALGALLALVPAVPEPVRAALAKVLEESLADAPTLPGRIVICPDVSPSMEVPVTGNRQSASTKLLCRDAAALLTVALWRKNPEAGVLAFDLGVQPISLDPQVDFQANHARLAGLRGNGTTISAPVRALVELRASVDLVILLSDNQSWADAPQPERTALLAAWDEVKARNPTARMICIDLQALGTSQAPERADILNLGGYTDGIFPAIQRFVGGGPSTDWVSLIKEVKL